MGAMGRITMKTRRAAALCAALAAVTVGAVAAPASGQTVHRAAAAATLCSRAITRTSPGGVSTARAGTLSVRRRSAATARTATGSTPPARARGTAESSAGFITRSQGFAHSINSTTTAGALTTRRAESIPLFRVAGRGTLEIVTFRCDRVGRPESATVDPESDTWVQGDGTPCWGVGQAPRS
jgi:hypothetical protein